MGGFLRQLRIQTVYFERMWLFTSNKDDWPGLMQSRKKWGKRAHKHDATSAGKPRMTWWNVERRRSEGKAVLKKSERHARKQKWSS